MNLQKMKKEVNGDVDLFHMNFIKGTKEAALLTSKLLETEAGFSDKFFSEVFADIFVYLTLTQEEKLSREMLSKIGETVVYKQGLCGDYTISLEQISQSIGFDLKRVMAGLILSTEHLYETVN